MPRGVKKEVVYTGEALKIFNETVDLETKLKAKKEALKVAYKEQVKKEREANKKATKKQQEELLKMIRESGKTAEEIMEMLKK